MGLTKGYVQIYTGEGKGKTTAALGLALRAVGRGLKVFMVQFMKAPDSSGEHFAARSLDKLLTIKALGRKGFIIGDPTPQDRQMALEALGEAKAAMLSGQYDLIILDEVNVAVSLTLLEVKDLADLIKTRPDQVELILTGRNAHPEIMALADLVSEIRPLKHYFDSGVRAREGIES